VFRKAKEIIQVVECRKSVLVQVNFWQTLCGSV